VLAAAEAQARAAAEGEPVTEERDKVVADLDAAADALRRPTIVSPASEPPSDVARGRGARAYPALRGAIVKLAHDDPAAAGRLLVGLLGAQHAVLSEPLDYDLSIAEIGTYAVRSGDGETLVTALEKPRGRTHAAFHLRGNALDLAELLAGVGDRPRRMRGAIRASGRVRDARRLAVGMDTGVGLADLLAAGADPDPDVVLRGFTYAVRPPWTSGQTWTVELVVDGRPFTVSARHSGGLTTHDGAHDGEPDARLRVSGQGFRDLVAGVEQPLRVEGDEAIVARLLSLVERARALGTE
jgi:hypothetical protein